MTGSARGTAKPSWGPTHATTCFETRYAMPAGQRDGRRERRSVIEAEDYGDGENRREGHPGKRDDLAPLLEPGGHGPVTPTNASSGSVTYFEANLCASSSWSRSDTPGSITRNVIAVVLLSRELGKRPSVFVIGGRARFREDPGHPQRDVRRPFDDAFLGLGRQAVRVALDDRDLARERDREEPLRVRGRVEGLRIVRKQARRREASASSRLGRNTAAPMVAAVQPATITQRRRTTVHANARANAVRLMRSGRVLCEDEVTGRARKRR